MRMSMLIFPLALALQCHPAAADQEATTSPGPLGALQMQIDSLAARVEELEVSAPDSNVDGRTYCMLVNSTILQGLASNATEAVATQVVRRFTVFSGGTVTSTLVSNLRNSQDDNGVVSLEPGVAPIVLAGTYAQFDSQLYVAFSDASTATWYVSGDGSTIYNNAIDLLGPFPNSLTIGIVRDATLIESDSCDGFPDS